MTRRRTIERAAKGILARQPGETQCVTIRFKVAWPVDEWRSEFSGFHGNERGESGCWSDNLMVGGNRRESGRVRMVFDHDVDSLADVFIKGEIYTVRAIVEWLEDVRYKDGRRSKKIRLTELLEIKCLSLGKNISRLQKEQRSLKKTDYWRKIGHQQAVDIARECFATAATTGIVTTMLVVENHRRQELRESERTYRLMLLDLLALADTALPQGGGPQHLEVVVARRKKDGVLMSTHGELLADVIGRIEDAIEVGLAARGLLQRIDAGHVRIWPAADSAGLALADFVANLSYNRHHQESRKLFRTLERRGRIRVFEAFGDHAERRARIAERDGDLAAALTQWSTLDLEGDAVERRQAALLRTWQRTMNCGLTGPMATLESALEWLWRHHRSPASLPTLAAALGRLETTLREVSGATTAPLVYRLRNLMHLVANQRGDLDTAARIIRHQNNMAESIAADPGLFHLILDEQLLRIITEELRLDFAAAMQLARAHVELVERYRAVWEVLNTHQGSAGFIQSRLWFKAQMTLLRTLLLSGGEENLREARGLLRAFPGSRAKAGDQARLDAYRVWAKLRGGHPEAAIRDAGYLLENDPGIHATQFAVRAGADVVMGGHKNLFGEARAILGLIRQRAANCSGYPGDLILRDMAVLERYAGDGRETAIKCLELSLGITRTQASSPVSAWIGLVTEVHVAEISGGKAPDAVLPGMAAKLRQRAQSLQEEHGALRAYRMVSPY